MHAQQDTIALEINRLKWLVQPAPTPEAAPGTFDFMTESLALALYALQEKSAQTRLIQLTAELENTA